MTADRNPQAPIPQIPVLSGQDLPSLLRWASAMTLALDEVSIQVAPLVYDVATAAKPFYTTGVATLDFDSGAMTASVVVTGITAITSASVVTAELRIQATAEHTVEDMLIDPIRVAVSDLVAGTGFTIEGAMDNAPANGTYQVNWIFY
jgi:hypothetical protein